MGSENVLTVIREYKIINKKSSIKQLYSENFKIEIVIIISTLFDIQPLHI